MALRRSSVKLSNFGKSNAELKVLISQLKTARETFVCHTKAHEQSMDDMSKWAFKDENRAIQDAVERFNDLFVLWSEAQREFAECLDDFRQNFKMILEGEHGVEAAKSDYEAVERREHKLFKELKKLSKKVGNQPNPPAEQLAQLRELEHKVKQVSQDKDMFKLEANDRIVEQEAVKMIRFKNALKRMTVGYLDLLDKCDICFSSGLEIVEALPDVEDKNIQKVRYTSAGTTLKATIKAKELTKGFRSRTARPKRAVAERARPRTHEGPDAQAQKDDDRPPPPYGEVQPPRNPFYDPDSSGRRPRSPLHDLSSSLNDSGASSGGNGNRHAHPYLLNTSNSYPTSPVLHSETETNQPSSAGSCYNR